MFHIATTREPPPPPEPSECSAPGADFVRRCLMLDAPRRPTAVQLLEHAWMHACREMLAQYAAAEAEAEMVQPQTPGGSMRSLRMPPGAEALDE
jgi:mitogen-activated protein kinase kinase kinase